VKINGTINSVTAHAAGDRAKSVGQASRQPNQSGDKVELSSLSASVQEAAAVSGTDQVADVARVAAIKQAIAEGRFQVNPERIANGLLDSVRQMLARQG
jgi:negative regulator of flagellin synthesis FlgM